ncbi:MAG: hypothetical protein LBS85_06765 [Clostridiales Family XIII bacterium]|jgi:hypothetical protein|nr:hypothetical protein [Clostridiales Family XIII bacterium]
MNDRGNNRARAFAAARLHLKNTKPAFLAAGIAAIAMLAQTLVMIILIASGNTAMKGSWDISFGNYLYLLPVLCAILIASRNFRRFMHLGGSRDLFFRGALIAYVVLAAAVSLANCVIHAVWDPAILKTGFFEVGVNLLDVFGWSAHGVALAFLRQFAFLFFAAVFAHTLSALQGTLAGWITDGVLIAILCVFTPIAPLRAAEAAFFKLILFTPSALLQIAACLALGAAIYIASKAVFNRKNL